MSYKLCPSHSIYGEAKSIIRLSDGACIPLDPDNTDYQEYIKWTQLSPANVAAPADE